jgi:hypothetical protein
MSNRQYITAFEKAIIIITVYEWLWKYLEKIVYKHKFTLRMKSHSQAEKDEDF